MRRLRLELADEPIEIGFVAFRQLHQEARTLDPSKHDDRQHRRDNKRHPAAFKSLQYVRREERLLDQQQRNDDQRHAP